MSCFYYKAHTLAKEKCQGLIEAHSMAHAKELLYQKQLFVSSIKEDKKYLTLSSHALQGFYHNLSQLMDAGLDLASSLHTLAENDDIPTIRYLAEQLAKSLHEGKPFHHALKMFPHIFHLSSLTALAAAEKSNALIETFRRLKRRLEKKQALKAHALKALSYPCLLLLVGFFVLLLVFFYTVPALEPLLEHTLSQNSEPLAFTISHFLQDAWPKLAFIGIVSLSTSICFFTLEAFRAKRDTLLLKLPLTCTAIVYVNLIEFSHTLAIMEKAGVHLGDSFPIAADSLTNTVLKKNIHALLKLLKEGKQLSAALQETPLIPPFFTKCLKIAEKQGHTAETLEYLAGHYEEKLEQIFNHMLTILNPLLLLLIASLIAFVLISILLPLSNLTSI